jgi:hypothetical protein
MERVIVLVKKVNNLGRSYLVLGGTVERQREDWETG